MTNAVEVGQLYAGRYRVRQRLGGGGTSEVYLVYDTQLARDVCLKRGVARGANTPDRLRRVFAHEAAALRLVGGATAPTLYEFAEAVPELFLEYCPGKTLAEYLSDWETSGRYPDASGAVRLVGRLAAAVRECHDRGLVVADLKPGNVLVAAADGGDYRLVLIDLGSAWVNGRPAGDAVDFTHGYGAPELLRTRTGPPAADVYSLGAILFALLAWREPGPGDPPRDYHRRAAAVPPDARRLVARMTADDPAARPSVAEVVAALAEIAVDLTAHSTGWITCPGCHETVAPASFCPKCGLKLGRGKTVPLAAGPADAGAGRGIDRAFADKAWLDVLALARQADGRGELSNADLARAVVALARMPPGAAADAERGHWLTLGGAVQADRLPPDLAPLFLAAWGRVLEAGGRDPAPFREWFRAGTERWPGAGEVWCRLAAASPAEEREAILRRGAAACPNGTEVALALADLTAAGGREGEALDWWTTAIQLGATDTRLVGRAYRAAVRLGDRVRADALLRQLLGAEPTDAREALTLARIAHATEHAARALALIDAGLEAEPLDHPLRRFKAEVLLDQRKYDLLLDHLKELPPDAELARLRGLAHYGLRAWAEAAAGLAEAAGVAGVADRVKLAACYLRLRQPDAAASVVRGLLAADPGGLREAIVAARDREPGDAALGTLARLV